MSIQLIPIKEIDIVLASSASWRSQILNQVGIPHRSFPHKYEEPKYKEPNFQEESLQGFIETLALKKAQSLEGDFPDSLIISADLLIAAEKKVFGKPGSKEAAIQQLKQLNGKVHRLICSVAVLFQKKAEVQTDIAYLTMRKLQDKEIQNYVERDQSWDCAGAYKIESLGASLFSKIETQDPNTIIGIPTTSLLDILRKKGFSNLL